MRKVSRKGLIAKVDRAFSRYIRQRAADENGNVACVTCGKVMPWQEIQAGHWTKRGHHATRWDERNVYPQCAAPCNMFMGGRQDDMAGHILAVHGPEVLRELLALKRTEKHWTMPELRELLERYGG